MRSANFPASCLRQLMYKPWQWALAANGDLWSALAEILRHESKAPMARSDLCRSPWIVLHFARARARGAQLQSMNTTFHTMCFSLFRNLWRFLNANWLPYHVKLSTRYCFDVVAPNRWLWLSKSLRNILTTFGFRLIFVRFRKFFWKLNFFHGGARTSKNLMRHQRETFNTNSGAQQPFQCILISDSLSKHHFFCDDGSGSAEWSALKESIHHKDLFAASSPRLIYSQSHCD